MKMTLKYAQQFGKVAAGNTKIPGTVFSTATNGCKTGSVLKNVEGSTCSGCYAVRIEKMRPSVFKGWSENLAKLERFAVEDPIGWRDSMVFQLRHLHRKKVGTVGHNLHRWFGSGDLPSLRVLKMIASVAVRTPEIRHWLPTREAAIVRQYVHTLNVVPENLTIRLSAAMVDQTPPPVPSYDIKTSTVHAADATGHNCPAVKQKGACGSCTACWDRGVANVSYKKH